MSNNLEHALGFVLGVTIVSVALVLVMMFVTSRDKKLKRKYDERQELIRGKGFKYACYTMLIGNMLYGAFDIAYDRIPIEAGVMCFFVALCGACVYAWYCILNGAYFALNERRKQIIICFFLISAFNLAIGISSIISGTIVKNGMLTYSCLNLVTGVAMLLTAVVVFIKMFID